MSLKDKSSVLNGVMADLKESWDNLEAAWPLDFRCVSDDPTERLSMAHKKTLEMLPLVREVYEASATLLDNLNHVCGILYGITTGREQTSRSIPSNANTLEEFERLLFELIRTKRVTLKGRTLDQNGRVNGYEANLILTGLEVRDHDMKAPE